MSKISPFLGDDSSFSWVQIVNLDSDVDVIWRYSSAYEYNLSYCHFHTKFWYRISSFNEYGILQYLIYLDLDIKYINKQPYCQMSSKLWRLVYYQFGYNIFFFGNWLVIFARLDLVCRSYTTTNDCLFSFGYITLPMWSTVADQVEMRSSWIMAGANIPIRRI